MAPHSSSLARKIPWMEEPGGLQSMGSLGVGHNWATELNWTDMCTHSQPLSCIWLFSIPWTIAHQASLSMGLPRQEYWSRLPFPSRGDLSDPGIESTSAVPALGGRFFTTEPLGKPVYRVQTRNMGPTKTWNPKEGVSCSMSSYHYWMKQSSEEQGRPTPKLVTVPGTKWTINAWLNNVK